MKALLKFKDIEISTDNSILIIRNSRLCRKFDLSCGAPKTVSLTDSENNEFASSDKATADIAFVGMYSATTSEFIRWKIKNISAETVAGSYKDTEHVKINVSMVEPFAETEYLSEYLIYPDFPAISVQNSISLQVQPLAYWTNRGQLNKSRYFTEQRESVADSICFGDGYRPKLSVSFRGRTDYHNELVIETTVENQEFLNGNILFCSNETGRGFCFLQEAPPSDERRDPEDYDFRISGNLIESCCWGIHPSETHRNCSFKGYRHDLLIYDSEQERIPLLKEFIRLRYPKKELSIMVNPWGCGKFRNYISEQFLIDEMKAAGEIHADFYQIDDEWQTGGSLTNLQSYNKRVREDFWTVSKERLNGSFDNIINAAQKADVKPALWIAPSMNCEYEDWQTVGDQIIDFYLKYGFTNFKIDGVLIRTKKAEDNLRAMLEYVREKTNGKVCFNLDTTNGQRPGYFLFLEYGNIFLENRYCYRFFDAEIDYHPERTLRNLWDLSKYICPADLQIEIACRDDIDPELTQPPEKCRPDIYPQEYWAAIALFANPLIWTAPSKISQEGKNIFKKMNDLHRKYRTQFADCEIYPIGERPNGKAVTGFIAWNKKTAKTFLLVFREQYSEQEKTVLELPYSSADKWKKISGKGDIKGTQKGSICIELPCRQYIFAESSDN